MLWLVRGVDEPPLNHWLLVRGVSFGSQWDSIWWGGLTLHLLCWSLVRGVDHYNKYIYLCVALAPVRWKIHYFGGEGKTSWVRATYNRVTTLIHKSFATDSQKIRVNSQVIRKVHIDIFTQFAVNSQVIRKRFAKSLIQRSFAYT